jgi:hypothetical protein
VQALLDQTTAIEIEAAILWAEIALALRDEYGASPDEPSALATPRTRPSAPLPCCAACRPRCATCRAGRGPAGHPSPFPLAA